MNKAAPSQEYDINKCPGCGGEADNGHDREVPPSPYYCTKCEAAPSQEPVATIHVDGSFVHVEWHGAAPNECHMQVFTTPPYAAAQKYPPDELTWLYTHCKAIGMDCKSDSGKWEHDIALFTTNQKQQLADAAAQIAELEKVRREMMTKWGHCVGEKDELKEQIAKLEAERDEWKDSAINGGNVGYLREQIATLVKTNVDYLERIAALKAKLAAAEKHAARYRWLRRKFCLTGNGDGTCSMHAINLPQSIIGWPDQDRIMEFCDASIDKEFGG